MFATKNMIFSVRIIYLKFFDIFYLNFRMDKRSTTGYIDQLNDMPPEVHQILSDIRDQDAKIL